MTIAITRQDLLPPHSYRDGRSEYIDKMISYKKNRRIKLAPHISLLFENRNTVLFQIQELVNSEDLTDPKEIDEYIAIYAGMLPDNNELSATLFIEMDIQETLQELLAQLKGIEQYLFMIAGGEKIRAVFEDEHDDREYTTSVHYLKFPLTPTVQAYLIDTASADVELCLVLKHPNLFSDIKLSPETVSSLQKDLA